MGNEQEFIPIEKGAALLNVSVKFLRRCIIASIVDFKINNDEILIDMTSVDNFIGIKDTAKILSVSPRTIRRYTKKESKKRLESYRFNQKLCYQLSDIEDFINKSSSESKNKRSC
ncbi:MAG: helix-turn-helix domain-containing protein [Nanoarchaeota archaeon]